MCTCAANVKRNCYFADGVKSIEHYGSWALVKDGSSGLFFISVFCVALQCLQPFQETSHHILFRVYCGWKPDYDDTAQFNKALWLSAVNGDCMWSLKMNNIESVLSAGKAGAKEPEGCFYILNHQPFFWFKQWWVQFSFQLLFCSSSQYESICFSSHISADDFRSNSADKRSFTLKMKMKHPVKPKRAKLKMKKLKKNFNAHIIYIQELILLYSFYLLLLCSKEVSLYLSWWDLDDPREASSLLKLVKDLPHKNILWFVAI